MMRIPCHQKVRDIVNIWFTYFSWNCQLHWHTCFYKFHWMHGVHSLEQSQSWPVAYLYMLNSGEMNATHECMHLIMLWSQRYMLKYANKWSVNPLEMRKNHAPTVLRKIKIIKKSDWQFVCLCVMTIIVSSWLNLGPHTIQLNASLDLELQMWIVRGNSPFRGIDNTLL